MLNREQILNKFDRAQEVVPVEQWGGDVTISALACGARTEILAQFSEHDKLRKEGDMGGFNRKWTAMQVQLVILSVTDAEGIPLFGPEDEPELLSKSPEVVGFLSDKILALNKFATSAVEDSAKN